MKLPQENAASTNVKAEDNDDMTDLPDIWQMYLDEKVKCSNSQSKPKVKELCGDNNVSKAIVRIQEDAVKESRGWLDEVRRLRQESIKQKASLSPPTSEYNSMITTLTPDLKFYRLQARIKHEITSLEDTKAQVSKELGVLKEKRRANRKRIAKVRGFLV